MKRTKVFAHARSVYDMDLSYLSKLKIKALIVDLDNTLEPADCFIPTPRAIKLKEEVESLGIRFIIISNNTKKRVAPYCEKMKVTYLSFAFKYCGFRVKRFLKKEGLEVSDCLFVGDQIFTDYQYTKKIKGRLVLTEPITEKDNWQTRYVRKIDKKIRASWRRKNLLGPEFPRRKEALHVS